ncbi:hypothetical protein F5B18DRAFT_105026 [Nemania serpens]|nr:hypothetical protein F5B18DRAFT_105026 [Nemania serpens]
MEETFLVFPVCFSLNTAMGLDYGPMEAVTISTKSYCIKRRCWSPHQPTSRIRAVSSSIIQSIYKLSLFHLTPGSWSTTTKT